MDRRQTYPEMILCSFLDNVELFKRLETDSFNFHSSNFDDFLSVFELGTKLCKLNLFKQDRFWHTLQVR